MNKKSWNRVAMTVTVGAVALVAMLPMSTSAIQPYRIAKGEEVWFVQISADDTSTSIAELNF
ncbi:MAG: hypothetical protein F6K19_16625 [Cyanothece sp. SIO1E1]|nr:hypothetical protein [Cyanothece sp. SIO1E1]